MIGSRLPIKVYSTAFRPAKDEHQDVVRPSLTWLKGVVLFVTLGRGTVLRLDEG
jgi:hypothetical protein